MPDTNTNTAASEASTTASAWEKFKNSPTTKDVKTLTQIGVGVLVTTAVVVASVKLGKRLGGTAANKTGDLIGLDEQATWTS